MNFVDRESRVQTVALLVLATVAVGVALYWLRPVLLPFVLAVFFVCGITPLLEGIQRRLGAPRIVAVFVAFLLGLVALMLLWLLIWASVASLIENAGTYERRIEEIAAWVADRVPENIWGGQSPDAQQAAAESSRSLTDYVGERTQYVLTHVSAALMNLLSSATMVLIFMFFLLLGGTPAAVAPSGVWAEIEASIRGYIVTKTLISLVTGVVFGTVLWLFGIPLALVFGLLAFLLNFIPNIGPIIASLLPLPLIVLNPELSAAEMVTVTALAAGVQFLSGNVLEPKIMGDSFELHPVAILLTLMFWGMLWGIVGMFLATPITAAVKILLEKFDRTRPVAALLEGRLGLLDQMGSDPDA